jgi:hypothetical protein
MNRVVLLLAALLVSACTMLSAPAPLFSAADNDPAFAPPEGLWAIRNPDCKVNPARSRPSRETCLDWLQISRTPDGGWRVVSVKDPADAPVRLSVAAAAPKRTEATRAPLYVAEAVGETNGEITYYAVVPRGDEERPFNRLAVAGVECAVTYGEWGEITGILLEREDGKVIRCTAQSRDAVREATRRAALAALPTLYESELVYVRPR